jgi:hypothetical protein
MVATISCGTESLHVEHSRLHSPDIIPFAITPSLVHMGAALRKRSWLTELHACRLHPHSVLSAVERCLSSLMPALRGGLRLASVG